MTCDDKSAGVERFVPEEMPASVIEAEHLSRYMFACPLAVGKVVLDAGCGVGYGARMLADAGATRVIGVDISTSAIERAETRSTDRTEFLVGDVAALDLPDASVDLIVCFEVIEHLADAPAALGEFVRVLGPYGAVVVSSPNPRTYVKANPFHVREYTPLELVELVAGHFPQVVLCRQDGVIASLVTSADPAEPAPLGQSAVRIETTDTLRAGEPLYAVVVASNGRVHVPRGLLLLGQTWEPRYWHERVETLTEELDAALREFEVLRGREAGLCSQLGELGACLLETETLAARLVEREAALAELAARLAEVESQREGLSTEAERLSAELGESDAARDRLQAWLDTVHSSRSWRITAPLRAVSWFFRGRGRS